MLIVAYVIWRCSTTHDRVILNEAGWLGFVAAPVLLVFAVTLFLRGRTLFGSVPRTWTIAATVPLIAAALWAFVCGFGMLAASHM
jgi:hypothetical protein